MESILLSIKKLLGPSGSYDNFDADIVMHINTVLADLTQIGIGPKEGFIIKDEDACWSDFIADSKILQSVKSYMYLRVKLLFDNSTLSAAVITSMERQIEKFEWRLSVAGDMTNTQ